MNAADPSIPPQGLSHRDGGPVFTEQWHAQAAAMSNLLVASGTIAAADWTQALGAALEHAREHGQPDDSDSYYRAVLDAMARLLDDTRAVSIYELDDRQEAWEHAYLRTPHGQPVTLD